MRLCDDMSECVVCGVWYDDMPSCPAVIDSSSKPMVGGGGLRG